MKQGICLLLLLFFTNSSVFSQRHFRVRKVAITGAETTEFILPPKAKLAGEGFIFRKKGSVTFKENSRFRYHYIIINGLDKEYKISKEAVDAASYKRISKDGRSRQLKNFNINTTAIKLGDKGFVNYYISTDEKNIVFEIDYGALLKDLKNFKSYYMDLFVQLSALNEKHRWSGIHGNITPEIAKKFFELLPVPQSGSLGRYMADIDDRKTFILLDPKIWLLVDNTIKTKPKMPYWDKEGKLDKNNDDFWTFNLTGQTLIRFYHGDNGAILQHPALKFSETVTLPFNAIDHKVAKFSGALLASTADIQLTRTLRTQHLMYLYQDYFSRNNSTGTNTEDDHDFSKNNSQLLFNKKISKEFLESIDSKNPPADINTKFSIFGLRSLINPVVPIIINKFTTTINFNSSLSIIKEQGIIPDVKKLDISRVYKNSYRKIMYVSKNLLLLGDDRIDF